MNPEYVIYGSLPWRLLRKRVGLWYAHGTVSNKLKLAVAISDNVYTSTSMGLRLETKKKVIVGQGIDINNFDLKKDNAGEPTATIKLITVGRINQSKKIETLINACKSLKEEGIDFCLSIYGQAQNDEEKIYQTNLEERINEFGLRDFVIFKGPVNQKDLPERLHESTFFIQDGRTGSLDKVLLESVACGIITLSSNESYKEFVGELSNLLTFPPGEAELLVELIKELSSNNVNHNEIITKLRNKVKEEHSIEKQIVKITTHLCQKR
jgi:glycosyltransferase involved in cell wall biosynthesis